MYVYIVPPTEFGLEIECMSDDFVDVSREGRVTVITITRPEARNALHLDAQQQLARAIDTFASDDDQWVAILAGKGGAFCAGMDLKSPLPRKADQLPAKGFGGLTSRFDLRKPLIAAVDGLALGGGFELALACDIIVASEAAEFALPEPQVGVAALTGGIQRLIREIGPKRAMGILLTGRRVNAREAYDLGFVTKLVSVDAIAGAREICDDILACAPRSLQATKAIGMQSLSGSLDESIATVWDLPAVQALLASEDAAEGRTAFVERRKPIWQNR